MVTTITNSGLANSSIIEPKETTVVVSGFGTGRTKDSKDKFIANGINNLKIVDSSNKIKQNGFSSFKVVPAIGTGSFDERFNVAFDGVSSTVTDALSSVQQDANNIKSTVLNMSNNLTTNYLSKAELTSYDNIINITSAIKEQTATFVTAEQAGGWYGLTLESDVKGKKYITGFDIGSIVYPESGINDSYFRINADRFIVGGDIGDGEFGGPLDENGEPLPAFSIVQDGTGSPQMYFNGKVNIASMPESVTKLIGKFAHISELNSYIAMHPEVVVRDGDSYLNTTENVIYFWDGDEWISAESRLELKSFVFKRSATKPTAPTGGNYSYNVPVGWNDGIPPAADTNTTAIDPVWVSMFVFDNKTDYTTLPPVWTEPEIMVDVPGESDVMFHNSLTTPPTPLYTGDETAIQQVDINNGWYNSSTTNAVWAANRKKSSGVWTSWYVYRIKGEKGEKGANGANGANGATGSRGSAILTGSLTNFSSISALFVSTFGGVINGDQYVQTDSSTGTTIYTYKGNWVNNTALTVHGDAVVNGTLAARKLVTNFLQSTAIYINDNNPSQSTPFGVSNAYFTTASKWGALVGVNTSSSGAGVGGKGYWGVHAVSDRVGGRGIVAHANSLSGVGVWGEGKQSGIVGVSTSAATTTSVGVYTPNKCQADSGFTPFTGSHIVFTLDEYIQEGDIVSTAFGFLMEVNQSYAEVIRADYTKDKTVLGVASSSLLNDVIEFTSTDRFLNDVETVGENQVYTIKEKYREFYEETFVKLPYKRVFVNSLGEGGINVCAVNGNIENGDYICSSVVGGKGMKQDDDLLHNYTVAKALENVIWDNEIVGEGGCFEQDGYKCKMIACTYHSG